MELSALLARKDVYDIIITENTIYLLTAPGTELPPIYSDKRIEPVPADALLKHEELQTILAGTPLNNEHPALHAWILYTYDYKGKDLSEKQHLAHKLSGTGGRNSLLETHGGKRVGRGAFLIPEDAQAQIDAFLTEHDITHTRKRVLLEGTP